MFKEEYFLLVTYLPINYTVIPRCDNYWCDTPGCDMFGCDTPS